MIPILQTHLAALVTIENTATADAIGETNSLRSAGWSWNGVREKYCWAGWSWSWWLEWCKRKIL